MGPKINGNPEKQTEHFLLKHSDFKFPHGVPLTFEGLKDFFTHVDVEGIVFHHKTDGRMCKIRKSDFGIKR